MQIIDLQRLAVDEDSGTADVTGWSTISVHCNNTNTVM